MSLAPPTAHPSPRPGRHRRGWWIAVIFALGFLWAGWAGGWLQPKQRFHIRDGRTFHVVASHVGTNLIAPTEGWNRLGRWVDKRVGLPKWVPLDRDPVARFTSGHPRLGIWFRETFPDSTEAVGRRQFYDPFPAFTLGETAGRFDRRYSSGNWDFVLLLHHYPRRRPSFDLGLKLSSSPGNPSGEAMETVRVVNPKPFRGPTWVPENLPATRQSNGMSFRLLNMTTTGKGFTAKPGYRVVTRDTIIRWDSKDSPDHPILVFDCVLSDPGGNNIRWIHPKGSGTDTPIQLYGGLFFDEPAWRVDVAVNTRPDGPPIGVVRSPSVPLTLITPLPADEDAAIDSRPVYNSPAEVAFQSALVPGVNFHRMRFSHSDNDGTARFVLSYSISGVPMGTRIHLAAVEDDQGRVWKVDGIEEGFSRDGRSGDEHYCWVRLAPDSIQGTPPRHLEAVFEIRQDTVLRFHVAPQFDNRGLKEDELLWPLRP